MHRLSTTHYPEDSAVFRRARLRLTAWHTAALALIVVGFSVALYAALAAELPSPRGEGPDLQPAQQAERDATDFALGRLRLLLVAGNAILLLGGALGAYGLAGKTLRPIALALARQRRFAADASHELRTPLTVMRGTLDVALQRERSAAVYRATLHDLGDEVAAMTALVEQLLCLARGQAAQTTPVRCDVRQILEVVIQAAGNLAAERSSSVSLAPGPPIPIVADSVGLRQALANLIRNALQHTAAGTVVSVCAGSRPDGIEVLVQDDGPGIPPEERERIFQPFYRLHTTGADGAGLGLALGRELIAANDGTIAVEETPGGGATFRVRLPCQLVEPTPPDQRS